MWQDFDETLPFEEESVKEWTEDGVGKRDLYFGGRTTKEGRVRIYARYLFPEGEESFPAVLILFEAGMPFDETLALRYVREGYGVLMADYCGENEQTSLYTRYPADIDYANYLRAGRHAEFCDDTAKETSWYEWACVARYAALYLAGRPEVKKIGAIGLRTGGEVLFKIAPYAPLSCMISVCGAGWLAYRGIGRFDSEAEKRVLNEERHRFIAGIDSQSYAPYVKCPILLISAVNDKKYNYDRVYDTFRQINRDVEKAILFSAHGSGLVGSHSLSDIDLFLEKYLKGRTVFLSEPVDISVEEDAEGNLVVRGKFDPEGEVKEYGIFYTENVSGFKSRDWTRVFGKAEALDPNNEGTIPLALYAGSTRALVYAFVNYSNSLSVTSKICEVNVERQYKNCCLASRVVFQEADGYNGFSAIRTRADSIGDVFSRGAASGMNLIAGYGGIRGICTCPGVISYRVGEPRYEPPEGASFRFDAYARATTRLRIIFYKDEEERLGFSDETVIEGNGKWKSLIFDPNDFKSETGAPLGDFRGVVSVVFLSDEEALVNNVLWI